MASSMSDLEATKAVNALSHYSSEDQEALLHVIEDYFDDNARSYECESGKAKAYNNNNNNLFF